MRPPPLGDDVKQARGRLAACSPQHLICICALATCRPAAGHAPSTTGGPHAPLLKQGLRPLLPAAQARILSWNVAGLRALLKKVKEAAEGRREEHIPHPLALAEQERADVLCLQARLGSRGGAAGSEAHAGCCAVPAGRHGWGAGAEGGWVTGCRTCCLLPCLALPPSVQTASPRVAMRPPRQLCLRLRPHARGLGTLSPGAGDQAAG